MKDFEIWANQLRKGNFNNNLPKGQNCINIDIKKYFNYQDCIKLTFERFTKHKMNNYKLEEITFKEYQFIEGTNRGGLSYLKEPCEIECFGYDYKAFYPALLAYSD